MAPATSRLRKIRSPLSDPQYSADQGPLPHISARDVMQQKYSINRLYEVYIMPESAVRNRENLT